MIKIKYIIMCGGKYKEWETPRQLIRIRGEAIIERTIRLLRENNVEDIAISTNNPAFEPIAERLDVPILHHENQWYVRGYEDVTGTWCNCFYPIEDPVCYILGDVIFSRAAIKKIVETETDSIEFFASAPPFATNYPKKYAEPFAFKVVDITKFWQAIDKLKEYESQGKFERHPIAWELWQVIKKTKLNELRYDNYVIINDYTCDIDWEKEVGLFQKVNLER